MDIFLPVYHVYLPWTSVDGLSGSKAGAWLRLFSLDYSLIIICVPHLPPFHAEKRIISYSLIVFPKTVQRCECNWALWITYVGWGGSDWCIWPSHEEAGWDTCSLCQSRQGSQICFQFQLPAYSHPGIYAAGGRTGEGFEWLDLCRTPGKPRFSSCLPALCPLQAFLELCQ